MKKKLWLPILAGLGVISAAVALILWLQGDANKPAPTTPSWSVLTKPETTESTELSTEPTVPPTQTESIQTEPTLPPETEAATETRPPETEPPAPTEPPIAPKLAYSSFGRYTGAFVEDGTDAPVENVAVLLVSNPTDRFLEYAQLKYDIDGKQATFVITGLPAGTSAWVLEMNRLVIEAGSVFTLVDESTSFSEGGNVKESMTITLGTGIMTAENTSTDILNNVYVYYRQLHTDGNYLGGITYRVSFGDLAPNAPMTATAGHCMPDTCQVVKITSE